MLGIPQYLYRLLPGNPILLRVVSLAGRRKRDLAVRCIYLGLLTGIVLLAILTGGSRYTGEVSFADLTKTSARIFQQMSYLQLALVALLAPVFTAGAITQEKDAQTYDILLSTPLSNAQIVLGSLFSRLFFILALLISGIPIFSITQIFGGVAIRSIATSFGIAAATAFVTGALAIAIATFKVGTRRTIFSFYLGIVVFLVGGLLLDRVEALHPVIGRETTPSGQAAIDPQTGREILLRAKTSWLTGINPFLALRSTFGEPEYTPPDLGKLPAGLQSWPIGWYLTRPHSFYIAFNFALSLLLTIPAILLLRRMAQSTFSLKYWLLQKLRLRQGVSGARRPRYVWHNPVAWREARTKASAARAWIVRYSFILGGMGGAIALLALFATTDSAETYISPGSYSPGTRTLFIQGIGGGTFLLSESTTITLNGRPVPPEVLTGRYKVAAPPTRERIGNREVLSSLALVDFPRKIDAQTTRRYLLGLILLEFAAILLIVTNSAASTVTREKEDGTLDLLLSTPITSRYYIWGKLRGLIAFVLPLIAVPVLSVSLFILHDLIRGLGGADPAFRWIVFPEALVILPAVLIIVAAFAAMMGMHMSLRLRTTVRAVMASVAIVLGTCGGLALCGFQILTSLTRAGSELALAMASFSPFTVVALLIDPYTAAAGQFDTMKPETIVRGRWLVLAFSLLATGIYAAVVHAMYVSMVRNFDMTIRRQSR
ncbi:MAG: ABC transporter permease subunit [Phycisphaerae bacterium]|nr:ABC transporter permease subunit [Phycisphaerae bacterium]